MENETDYLTETREFVRRFYSSTRFSKPEDIKNFIDDFGEEKLQANSNLSIHLSTVLILATEHQDHDLIADARKFGAEHWIRPLGLAVYFKCTEMIRRLVSHGVDINSEADSYRGWRAIELACWIRHVPTISLILELGADVSEQVGVRCLERCINNEVALRMLVAKGADVNGTTGGRGGSGGSLLSLAMMRNLSTIRDILYENGASMECIGDKELYTACCSGSREMVEFILDKTQARVAKRIEALELLGASYICIHTNTETLHTAFSVWVEAVLLRQTAEQGSLLTNDDRCSVMAGFQLVDVPNNVTEVLALTSRPADAYVLGLMMMYKYVAPTCPDLETQILYCAPDHIRALDPTVDIRSNPQYMIDLYMLHLRALAFYRKLLLLPRSQRTYNLGEMTSQGSILPFPVVSYPPCLHRRLLNKQRSLVNKMIQITPEVRNRWVNAGMDILEAMVEESELFIRLEKFVDYTGHPEEEVAGIRAATSCQNFPLMHTMEFLVFMFMLHTDRIESTYIRLQSFTFRFIQCCESDPEKRCALLNHAVRRDVTLMSGMANDDNISSTPNQQLPLTRFLIKCGADSSYTDAVGDTPLHCLYADHLQDPMVFMSSLQNAKGKCSSSSWLKHLTQLVKTLVELGIHPDARNLKGQVVSRTMCKLFPSVFHRFQFETLQCLSARELRRINYPPREIPQHLSRFVSMH